MPLEVVVARLERALGEESAKLMHRTLEFWRTTKNEAARGCFASLGLAKPFTW